MGNKGDYEKALSSFEQALKLKPDFTNALIGKGVDFEKLGRTNEAKLCAEKALEMKTASEKEKSVQSNSTNDAIQKEYEATQKKFKKTLARVAVPKLVNNGFYSSSGFVFVSDFHSLPMLTEVFQAFRFEF